MSLLFTDKEIAFEMNVPILTNRMHLWSGVDGDLPTVLAKMISSFVDLSPEKITTVLQEQPQAEHLRNLNCVSAAILFALGWQPRLKQEFTSDVKTAMMHSILRHLTEIQILTMAITSLHRAVGCLGMSLRCSFVSSPIVALELQRFNEAGCIEGTMRITSLPIPSEVRMSLLPGELRHIHSVIGIGLTAESRTFMRTLAMYYNQTLRGADVLCDAGEVLRYVRPENRTCRINSRQQLVQLRQQSMLSVCARKVWETADADKLLIPHERVRALLLDSRT